MAATAAKSPNHHPSAKLTGLLEPYSDTNYNNNNNMTYMALTTNQNSMNNSISQVNKQQQNYQNAQPPGHFTLSGFTGGLESPASTTH